MRWGSSWLLISGLTLLTSLLTSTAQAATGTIPETYADWVNRVFTRTAPNGFVEARRLLPDGAFEPLGSYKTNLATYTRDAVGADQGVLNFATSDVINGKLYWQNYKYLLTFATPTNGTYDLEFTTDSVAGVQKFAGPFSLSVGNNIPPFINLHPQGGAMGAGATPFLTVNVAGFDLSYQWYRNGEAIPNATKFNYQPGPLSAANVGDYFVTAANSLGAATSQVARLEIVSAPQIVKQPSSARVIEGMNATLSVEATGGALNYEWQINGNYLGAANAPSITLSNVTAAAAGSYTVRVYNNAGSVTSQPALIEVCAPDMAATFRGRPWVKILRSRDPVPGTESTLGPLGAPFNPIFTLWDRTIHAAPRADNDKANAQVYHTALVRWRDGTLQTLVYTNTLVPNSNQVLEYPYYPTDEGDGGVNFQFSSMYEYRNGTVTEIVGSSTPVPGRTGVTFGPTGSHARRGPVTLLCATLNVEPQFGGGVGLYVHDAAGLRRIADDTSDLPGVMSGYAYRAVEDAVNLDDRTLVFTTINPDNQTAGVFRSTYDGTITKLLDTGDLLPGLTNKVVNFGDVDVEGGAVFAIVGLQVRTVVQNRVVAFWPEGSIEVIGLGDYLVAGGPRQVYYGNSGQIVCWTDGVTEEVVRVNHVLDCQRISGLFDVEAQGDDVAIGVVFQDKSAGIYANFGRAGTGAPKILAQPASLTVPATTPAVFSVSAYGAEPIGYQWRRNGQVIAGATEPVLAINSALAGDQADYDVLVTAGGSEVASAVAKLTLTDPPLKPIIHQHPGNVSVPIGTSGSLTVLASGAPPLSYQWYLKGVPVDGATGSTLNLNTPTNASFQVVISNQTAAVTSYVATISVLPVITRAPQPVSVPTGGTATFTVEASGFAQINYLWFKDSKVLTGQTNATLVLQNVQPADAGSYWVNVSGQGGGTYRTEAVKLTVDGGSTGSTPKLEAPLLVGGQLQVSFQTQAGKSYALEFKARLNDAQWGSAETVAGDGSKKTVKLGLAGSAGFYRLVEQP